MESRRQLIGVGIGALVGAVLGMIIGRLVFGSEVAGYVGIALGVAIGYYSGELWPDDRSHRPFSTPPSSPTGIYNPSRAGVLGRGYGPLSL